MDVRSYPETLLDASLLFWVGLVVATVISKPIFASLLKFKARQSIYQYAPGTHQVKQGTPTMGGLIVVIAFALACLGWYIKDLLNPNQTAFLRPFVPWGVLLAFLGFALIGFFDDFVMPKLRKAKRGFAWKEKIVLQALAAFGGLWCYYGGTDYRVLLGVVIILFAANAYNFADGLDGLAGSIFVGLAIGLVALNHGSHWISASTLALLGAMVPFLFLNAPPAKLFMGDVGSLAIGAFLGFCLTDMVMVSGPTATMDWPWIKVDRVLPALLLSGMLFVELVPVPIQIASVKLFKRRMFPFTPVHHAFEKAGWPETRVVWAFALAQLLFTLAAVTAAGYTYSGRIDWESLIVRATP